MAVFREGAGKPGKLLDFLPAPDGFGPVAVHASRKLTGGQSGRQEGEQVHPMLRIVDAEARGTQEEIIQAKARHQRRHQSFHRTPDQSDAEDRQHQHQRGGCDVELGQVGRRGQKQGDCAGRQADTRRSSQYAAHRGAL